MSENRNLRLKWRNMLGADINMSNTINIEFGEHFTKFVGDLIDSGRYTSVDEVVRSALRLLELEEVKISTLNNALIEGENSGESSRLFEDILNEVKGGKERD